MNKRTAKRIRQNNHRLYHESVKCEIKFKQAVKALPINIEMLTKGKLNESTHIKRANAAETNGRG